MTRAARCLVALFAAALGPMHAAAAATAEDVLGSAEEHCIQPGGATDWFLTPPKGWSRVAPAQLEDAFMAAASSVSTYYGKRFFGDDDAAAAKAKIDAEILEKAGDLLEDHAEGQVMVAAHDTTRALLVVEMERGGNWLHTECTLMPTAEDTGLAGLIRDRWTLPVPAFETPYGTGYSLQFVIARNGLLSDLHADVHEIPPSIGAAPIILQLLLRAP